MKELREIEMKSLFLSSNQMITEIVIRKYRKRVEKQFL